MDAYTGPGPAAGTLSIELAARLEIERLKAARVRWVVGTLIAVALAAIYLFRWDVHTTRDAAGYAVDRWTGTVWWLRADERREVKPEGGENAWGDKPAS